MSNNRIHVNYDEMRATAANFQRQSEAVNALINTLKSRTAELKGSWEGVAEREFMIQLESCQRRMARTPQLLSQIAAALRTTADIIQQAEEEARRTIRNTITSDN